MAVEIEEIGPCKVKVHVQLDRETVRGEIDQQLRSIARQIALPGFRRGKVPPRLIERRFGDQVRDQVRGDLVQKAFASAVEENELEPIGEPSLEVETFDPEADPALVFHVELLLRPRFELPDLDGIVVEKPAVVVTDADVEEAIASLRRSRSKLVDREEGAGVQPGDLVVARVEFLGDGEVKHTEENLSVWPENNRVGPVEIEGLADKLAGHGVGDVVEIPATIPEALGVEGDEQALRITIERVRKLELPELDEAFAEQFGCDTIDELRERVRERLERDREQQAERQLEQAVVDQVLERVEFELPEEIVERELDEMALRARMTALMQGRSEEDAVLEAGKVRAESESDVRKDLKANFVLEKVAQEKRLFATEDEIARRVVELASAAGQDPQEYYEQLQRRGQLNALRHVLRLEKARAYLRAKAEVKEAEAAATS